MLNQKETAMASISKSEGKKVFPMRLIRNALSQ